MQSRCSLLACAVVSIISLCLELPQVWAKPLLLHGFESLEGTSFSYGTACAHKEKELCDTPSQITEGKHSLHLRGISDQAEGNKYLGLKFTLPTFDMRRRRILLDAATPTPRYTRALYLRLYDDEGKLVASWANWSAPLSERMQTFIFALRVSRKGFRFEETILQSNRLDKVRTIELIIGTSEKGVPFSAYFDNLRLEEYDMRTMQEISQPWNFQRDTPLLDDGKPAAIIVAPERDEFYQIALSLQKKLQQQWQISLPIFKDAQSSSQELPQQHVLLLGNAANNSLIRYLYARYQTAVDEVFPGAGGYELRTVLNPWGNGVNAVVLGGSDAKGVVAAVEELLKRLDGRESPTVSPTLSITLGADAQQRFGSIFTKPGADYVEQQLQGGRSDLARGAHTGVTSRMVNNGLRYAWTGMRPFAEAFRALAFLMFDHYLSKPDTYGGPWGMDADFTLHQLIPAWNAVETCDSLSNEDRLKITKILYEFITTDVVGKARSVVGNRWVRFNHQTFPALGLFYAADYFLKYYHLAEAEEWMDIADECFQIQALSSKPHEDCNGYQWLTLGHTLRYALAKPDFTIFENGNARKIADHCIITMDNLGYQASYGDVGSPFGWFSEYVPLKAAEWFYRDGRYSWVIERKKELRSTNVLNDFETAHQAVEPVDLARPMVWPLEPMFYETFPEEGRPPLEKCLDKLVFRTSFDPQKQYLLLDGLSNGSHKHYDGNSIVRLTQNARLWLADCDYIKSLPKFHNGVLIFRNGESQTIPSYVEVERFADLPFVAFSTTTLRDYAGVDWHRHIIWKKERYFIVVDQMEAKEDGEFDFRCVWRGLGKPTLTAEGMLLEQEGGERFHIQTIPGRELKLNNDPEYGRNYRDYKFCEPVVRNLKILASPKLNVGQTYNHVTLLYGENDSRPLHLRIAALAASAYLVMGEESALVGVGAPNKTIQLPTGMTIAAAQFHIDSHAASLVETTELRWSLGDSLLILKSEKPVTLTIDFAKGQVKSKDGNLQVQGLRPGMEAIVGRAISSLSRSALPPEQIRPRKELQAPLMKRVWSFQEKLTEYLLTGNAGQFGAVDVGAKISASPAPTGVNLFSGKPQAPDALLRLVDGGTGSTEECVMWDDDVPVTLTIDLRKPYKVSRILLKAWFATSSSKGRIFQVGHILGEVSNDGFRKDMRRIIDFTDNSMHGNWGEPVPYKFENLECEASQIRLRLTPRAGTGIYLAEIEVWGNRAGLAQELSQRKITPSPQSTFTSLVATDLNGDVQPEIIAGSTDGRVLAIDSSGNVLWTFPTDGTVHSVAVADIDGNGRMEVIVGSEDTRVYALDATGKELWRFEVPFYKRKPIVRTVFVADLEGDGKQEIIAGADSWRYYALDCQGKERWHFESVHGSTAGCAADLDGDGKVEVICGTEYYWWPCVGFDGKRRWSYSSRTGPKCNSVCAADIDGDGKKEVIFGGADGNVTVVDATGKLLWQFNTGDEITEVLARDIDKDDQAEIIASSLNFHVYALKGDSTRLWRCNLGDAVTRTVPCPPAMTGFIGSKQPCLVAGTESGDVVLLSSQGTIISRQNMGAAVSAIAVLSAPGYPLRVAVASSTGELALWQP